MVKKTDEEEREGYADGCSNILREDGPERGGEGYGANEEPDGFEPRDGRRFLNDGVELLDVRKENVSRDLAAQEYWIGGREAGRRARGVVLE
jgi:hypothetical protein